MLGGSNKILDYILSFFKENEQKVPNEMKNYTIVVRLYYSGKSFSIFSNR